MNHPDPTSVPTHMTHHPRRPLRPLLAIAAAVLLMAAACGSDDYKSGTSDTTAAPSGDQSGDGYGSGDKGGTDGSSSDEYTVVAMDFSLTDLTVGPGEEFTLDNQGDSTHTLTADDGEFDSGEVDAGSQSDALTAPDEPGTYTFHCEIHDSMTATLTVEAE